MTYQNILITGGSGKVGRKLLVSDLSKRTIIAPTSKEMDITNSKQVLNYFKKHKIDAVIHCAAFTDLKKCARNPQKAIEANIVGTSNIVNAVLKKNARMIYISTDYVYPGTKGPYSEEDKTIPFTAYGWTKLGGECAVRTLKNYCILRTSFFEPENIHFDTAPSDAFFSKIPLQELIQAIKFLLDSKFIGVINVGQKRASMYHILKKHKTSMKAISIEDLPSSRAKDSSLEIKLWEKVKRKKA